MTIEEAFVELENYVDASDPDMDLLRTTIPYVAGLGAVVFSSTT